MARANSIMEFETLKGTNDSTPKEQIKINKILDVIRNNFESYGFRPFDTPIIEYLDTLTLKYDEDAEIVNEIFKVTDRGERKLGLRYDLTTPLSRFVAANNKALKKPFRRYQIGKVFRDGPLKKGRLREFIQCDGDVIGVSGVEIEAELLQLFFSTYEELGIDAVIEVNNNKILRGSFLQEGFYEKDLSSLILSVDKLKKIGLDGVLKEIEEKGLDSSKAIKAIDILDCKSLEDMEKVAVNELLKEGINELKKLIELMEPFVDYKINFSMARGLDIYTGNIWETFEKNEKISSSIGSGGRFDKVIADYAGINEEIPAVGISFGLAPILACLEKKDERDGISDILMVPLEKSLVADCFKIASKLRNEGKKTEMYYGYKLKKAFDYAQYLGTENIVIYGKKDKENKEYIIKNIDSGVEKKIKF